MSLNDEFTFKVMDDDMFKDDCVFFNSSLIKKGWNGHDESFGTLFQWRS